MQRNIWFLLENLLRSDDIMVSNPKLAAYLPPKEAIFSHNRVRDEELAGGLSQDDSASALRCALAVVRWSQTSVRRILSMLLRDGFVFWVDQAGRVA